ncbi:hypothetical protein FLJC2902T_22130 [Flavobacterium limnosediminis JC2902]|uniref:Secretion system C-terminal sorting domain-containing protein n=1 Tax=Flavobacterium limnosediminis JC2902 TaxID=1341181 RepID=V6SLD0_9FLAO|nr:T9SS type A sorting domain-containing protein [Flavobacterium limnosediminis]ESU27239.1 hypothetical protein FLJC2902T_22130 [Flavobacterium limnosediminis JC2902]
MRKIIFLISFLASLVIYAQDGSLDISFNVQGQVSPETILKLQPDGKIILVERFTGGGGFVESTKINRLNPDGSYDLDFASGIGVTVYPEVKMIALQSDGKIIICGNFDRLENTVTGNLAATGNLARLNQDGSLDTSFSKAPVRNIQTVVVQPDDKILIGGGFLRGIVRLYSNGDVDPFFRSPIDLSSFGIGGGSVLSNMVLLTDNRILAVGNVSIQGNVRRIFLMNSEGELDSNFYEPENIDWTNGDTWNPKFLTVEKTGNILIGWPFKVLSDTNDIIGYNFVRLDPNGNIMNVFQPHPYTDDCVLRVFPSALQDDGKIIIRGSECFDYYGYDFRGIGRLNADGLFDDTFSPGTGTNDYVTDTAVQSDGRIILVGYFTEFNGMLVNNIIRLNSSRLSSSEFNNTDMRVYPNPVTDNLYIQFPNNMNEIDIDELEVFDVTMKKIDFDGLNNDVIDVSDFSSGVYLLKVKTENSIFTSKFVKR